MVFLAKEKFTSDEASFDRFSQTGIVSDEEVDARQTERFAERLHLVGVNLDSSSERRLKQIWIGGSHTVPSQRVQKRGKLAGLVEALSS
jgi:hypothetical protein